MLAWCVLKARELRRSNWNRNFQKRSFWDWLDGSEGGKCIKFSNDKVDYEEGDCFDYIDSERSGMKK